MISTQPCQHCGKRFSRYITTREPRPKYCGKPCQYAGMRTGKTRTAFRRNPGVKTVDRYPASHTHARQAYLDALRDGDPCNRCGRPMYRAEGSALHLDHDDHDRRRYRGLAHAQCNVIAGARLGGQRAKAARLAKQRRRAA